MTAAAGASRGRRAAAEPAAGPRRTTLRLAAIALLALIGIAVLLALGAWQVRRLGWKLDLIARVEQRVRAPAAAAPGPAEWAAVTEANAAYRHVRVRGTLLHGSETVVRAATDLGSGYWVLTPLRTDTGFIVIVNRGFVPPERRDPATRAAGRIGGETEVGGLLRISEPNGGFLRANDPAGDRWYSRDVAAIAAARHLHHVAPYFIDADATPNVGGWPRGGLTVVRFPNNHLGYAITWFAMAAGLAAGAAIVARHEWRARRPA